MNNEYLIHNEDGEFVSKNKTRKIKASDIVAYLICLLISFSVWAYIVSLENQNYEYTFEQVLVQLDGVNELQSDKNLSIINGYDNRISITVVGSRKDIIKYSSEDIFAHVNLDGINDADRYSLDVMVDLPDGVKLVSAQPSKINVFVDEITSFTVDLNIELLYNVAAELTIHEAEPSVETILVTGPRTVLNDIYMAKITYDLGTVKTSVNFSSTITLVDKDGNEVVNPYVKTDVSSVEVKVPVTTDKVVSLVADYSATDAEQFNYNILFEPYTVTVSGDPRILDELSVVNVALGDVTEVSSGEVTTNHIQLPTGVKLVNQDLKTVFYTVFKTEIGK